MSNDPPRVLVVEDEYLVAESYRTALKELGYEVAAVAPSVRAALQTLGQERVDIAIFDVVLRDTTVIAAARKARELGIPFVFATGMAEPDLPVGEFDGVPVLDKPTPVQQLSAALALALAQHR